MKWLGFFRSLFDPNQWTLTEARKYEERARCAVHANARLYGPNADKYREALKEWGTARELVAELERGNYGRG